MTRRCKFTTSYSIIPLVNHLSNGSKCIVVYGISGKNFGLWLAVNRFSCLCFVMYFVFCVHVRRGEGEDKNWGRGGKRDVKVTEKLYPRVLFSSPTTHRIQAGCRWERIFYKRKVPGEKRRGILSLDSLRYAGNLPIFPQGLGNKAKGRPREERMMGGEACTQF